MLALEATPGTDSMLERLRALALPGPFGPDEALLLAERQARALRRELSVRGVYAPDDAFATLPFARVTTRFDLQASGITIRTGNRYDIALAADEPRTRQRMTLLHEVKHVLDDRDFERLYPWAGRLDFDPDVERICDRFALAFLMPAPSLRRAWRRRPDVESLGRRYGVSQRAVERRLHALGLDPAEPSPITISHHEGTHE